MFDRESFEKNKELSANKLSHDQSLREKGMGLLADAAAYSYAYQFTWMNLPVIQLPQDLFVTQELIVKTQPDVIIETGVAWGGSVCFHAGVLDNLGKGRLIAIDRNIPAHVREKIMATKYSDRITLIEGDSSDASVVEAVRRLISTGDRVSAFFDSNHSHEHVLKELKGLGSLVTSGQYLTVYATAINELPEAGNQGKEWSRSRNPQTAINEFLSTSSRFEIDRHYDNKLLYSFAFNGRLLCR